MAQQIMFNCNINNHWGFNSYASEWWIISIIFICNRLPNTCLYNSSVLYLSTNAKFSCPAPLVLSRVAG